MATPLRLNLDRTQTVRLGILALAFILCVAAFFLSWWTINSSGKSGERRYDIDQTVSPFDAGYFGDANAFAGEGLDTEVAVTGWLFVVATLGVAGCLGLEVLRALGRPATMVLDGSLAGAAGLPTLLAVVYTAFAWPAGWVDGTTFFDHEKVRNAVGFQADVSYFAGLGWYLAILGGLAAPVGIFLFTHIFNPDPGMDQVMREAGVTQSPATPVPAPQPAPAAPSSAAPTFTTGRAAVHDPAPAGRRVSVLRPKND